MEKAFIPKYPDWVLEFKQWLETLLKGHVHKISAKATFIDNCKRFPVVFLRTVTGKSGADCLCPSVTLGPGEVVLIVEVIGRASDSVNVTNLANHIWATADGTINEKLCNFIVNCMEPTDVRDGYETLVDKRMPNNSIDFFTRAMTIKITPI